MPKYDDQGNLINEEEVEQEDHSQDEAQNEEVQDEVQEEETQDEQEEESTEDESEEESEDEEQEERPPSRREQLRINNLLRKYGDPTLQKKAPESKGVDYRNMIDADEEVYDQLSRASQEYGKAQYEEGLREAQRMRFETRLELDAPKVEKQFPQLDKTAEEFNPAVANAFNQFYLNAVGYDEKTGYVKNDNLRYSDYAEAFFEMVEEASSRKVETTRRNVTRQAARTGIRPSGGTAKTNVDLNMAPSAMSDKQLDAALAKMGLAPKGKP